MDITVAHYKITSSGGGDRVLLEIAKKFNPIIYTTAYEKTGLFPEFKEFDIRVLPKTVYEYPLKLIQSEQRQFGAAQGGFRFLSTKLKENYDVLVAMGSPSEWLRLQNPRMSWYCFSPNREMYDLYDFRMKEKSLPLQLLTKGLLSAYKIGEMLTVPKIEQILTSSEIVQDRIAKYLKRDDSIVVNPSVDHTLFTNESYDRYFIYPSRFVPEKRFEYAIEAFRLFCQVNHDLRWKLILIGHFTGNPRDTAYMNKLKEAAKGLNIEFRFGISDQELKKLYGNCTAVLFAGMDEDYGLIPLEAMSAEKPIISVNEGGCKYTIVDKETGFLVNSEKEMAAQMVYLSENPNEAEKIGKKGRQRVLDKYTTKQFLDGLEKNWKKVAK